MYNTSPNVMADVLKNIPPDIVIPDEVFTANDEHKAREISKLKDDVLEYYAGPEGCSTTSLLRGKNGNHFFLIDVINKPNNITI